jgi:hypothetical protein
MWPFKKKEKYQVYFTCDEWAIRKYSPIQPAKNFLPTGFKDMDTILHKKPHPLDTHKTIKSCPGIIDFSSAGFVIPAWCDIEIMPSPDGKQVSVRYSHPKFQHAGHPPEALQNFMSTKFSVRATVKLDNPWAMWSAPGYSLLYLPLYYYDDNRNWESIAGWMDNDQGNLINPINIMLKEPKYTLIKQGEPIVQVIPIKREEITAYTGNREKTGAARFAGISYLQMMSFAGWMKYVKAKKSYTVDAHHTELPTEIEN